MGLSNVRTESWGQFGMGWHQRNVWTRMIEPDLATFIAQAAPWSPATPGPVTADLVAVRGFTEEEQFEPYRGKLRGRIALLARAKGPPDVTPIDKPLFERLDDRQLTEFAESKPDADTNMDSYEHLIPEDLRQAAIVVATMVYNTAMRDQMLPRRSSRQ